MTKKQAEADRAERIKEEQQKEELVPRLTKVFLINYANLDELEKIVKDYLTPKRSAIQKDVRTNSLIIRDIPESIERIKKIIDVLDTQTPQVLIESKIVEATENYSKRIGLQRGISFGYDPVSQYGEATGPGFSFSSAPTSNSPGFMGATIAIYKRLLNLDFNLQLMESEAKGRIISTPKIVTQNKVEATITSTEETSYRVQQQATGTQVALATFEKVSADLTLKVTPHVTNDGAVIMDIDLKKSAFGSRPTNDSPPDQTSRNIKTKVLVDNGSTIVIGGLYQTSTLETVSGVPFLKDLPLVGWLFRTPQAPDTTKNELIIFMTPRVMNQEAMGMSQRQANLNASDVSTSSEL
jgi:type IV pilus assembly protein PilQ